MILRRCCPWQFFRGEGPSVDSYLHIRQFMIARPCSLSDGSAIRLHSDTAPPPGDTVFFDISETTGRYAHVSGL